MYIKTIFFTFFFSLFLSLSATAQGVSAYPDNSPSIEDWEKMGISRLDTIWEYTDYNTAFDLLDLIFEADKFSLPRKNSSFSGKLYERMLNPENFAELWDDNLNLGNRIIKFEKVKHIGFRLLIYYVEQTELYERFGAEVLDCILLDANISLTGLLLYNELEANLTSNQKSQENYTRGKSEIIRNFNRSAEEAFKVLETDYDRYDPETLEKYTVTFCNISKKITQLPQNDNFKKRIDYLTKKHPSKSVRNILKEGL